MKINKKDLLSALDIVKPGLSSKEIIEQTTSFIFKDKLVITFNDEISISTPIIDLGFEGAIKATELFDFLKKITNDEITISFNENEKEVVLKAGRAKVGFSIAEKIVLPIDEELAVKSEWKKLPNRFVQALKFTIPCTSNDMSNPKITCVNLTKSGFAEATDNFRVVRFNMQRKMPLDDNIIPASSLREVVKLNPKFASYGNGWIHFKNENGTIISCRTFEEEFVDVQSIIDIKDDGFLFTFPTNLTEVLTKAEIFTKSQSKLSDDATVDVIINNKLLTIRCESDTAWFEESIKIPDYSGGNFSFAITPYLLKFIMEQTNVCLITEHSLRFEGENWIYISTLAE